MKSLCGMILAAAVAGVAVAGTTNAPAGGTAGGTETNEAGWTAMFDGRSLAGWRCTEFSGAGEVRVQTGAPLPDGVPGPKEGPALILGEGNDLTGVNYTNAFPRTNYEIRLEAMRVRGGDFFCGLTFPVDRTNCTLVVGGWGGGLVGISSLDGMDASENETSTFTNFKNGQWYEIRVCVRPDRIRAWIDGESVVNIQIEDRKVHMRFGEIEMSGPLGLATWRTAGAFRNIRIRPLPPESK